MTDLKNSEKCWWDFLKGAAAEPFVDAEPRERLMAGLKSALEL